MKSKSIFKIILSMCILVLSACSEDPAAPAGPGAPVLTPIGNKVLLINELFTMQLEASDPNGDVLTFSYPENFPGTNTHNRPNFSTFTADGLFSWTPESAAQGIVFTEQFIVSDTTEPEPLQDSEVVLFTVMGTRGGFLYMSHCAECHGDDAGGGVQPVTNVEGTNLTGRITATANLPAFDVTSIQNSMDDTQEMSYLKNEQFTTTDLQEIIDYVNTLPVIF